MKRAALLASCLLGLLLFAAEARARDVHVYVQAALGSHYYTGMIGQESSGSIALNLVQGLQFGHYGVYVSIGGDLHLTHQSGPPLVHALQTSSIATGLRFEFPVGAFVPVVAVEYESLGLSTNPLVRLTGPGRRAHALGVEAGLRYMVLDPIYIEATGEGSWFPGLEERTFRLGYFVGIGIAGRI